MQCRINAIHDFVAGIFQGSNAAWYPARNSWSSLTKCLDDSRQLCSVRETFREIHGKSPDYCHQIILTSICPTRNDKVEDLDDSVSQAITLPVLAAVEIQKRKSQNHCDYCTYIYVHGLCDRNMGLLPTSNRHFTVSPHEVFT